MHLRRVCLIQVLSIACCLAACNQTNSPGKNGTEEESGKAVTHHEKSNKKIKPTSIDLAKPVATFEVNMQDPLNNIDFIVKVFPTMDDDKFKIDIQYGANTASDELKMIPSEYYKKISLIKGNNNNECIVGFIDNSGRFNKMKLITGSGTSISIKTLKAYYLSTK